MRRSCVGAALDQPLDAAPIDLVGLGVQHRFAVEPQVHRMDRLVVHATEDLGAKVLEPIRVQVHHPELAQCLDVDHTRYHRVVAGDGGVCPRFG